MKSLAFLWDKLEEILIVLSLALMTLVTFIYVVLNNAYQPFLMLADNYESLKPIAEPIALFIMTLAMEMTWSQALTKLFFGALIFLGASYGVRTAGHIGIDILIRKFSPNARRAISILACLLCLAFCALIIYASSGWIGAMYTADIGAEDLQDFNIKVWQIGMIVPIGFAMVFIRFIEVLLRLFRGQQNDLGLADEASDALKLNEEDKE
ncbi:TRAP transporter small permease [Pelistega europaea]|uniref:TRAP transporter small permease protein n=1 Tax=Pelistega europaea TaxID=106147 RepID=A0A7Y4L9A8_9BURK|nr:TRAP transporter small permease [Pelistega europaea]NOL49340.1 TRAP transporter small permease [Pelistega europaea]